MISFFFMLVCVVAIVVALISKLLWGWAILGAVCAILLVILGAFKARRWSPPAELSDQAAGVFRKFGYFYLAPLTCQQYGTAAIATLPSAAILAVIGAFRGFWWGFAIMAAVWILMYRVAMSFNPGIALAKSRQSAAHREIVSFLQAGMLGANQQID